MVGRSLWFLIFEGKCDLVFIILNLSTETTWPRLHHGILFVTEYIILRRLEYFNVKQNTWPTCPTSGVGWHMVWHITSITREKLYKKDKFFKVNSHNFTLTYITFTLA